MPKLAFKERKKIKAPKPPEIKNLSIRSNIVVPKPKKEAEADFTIFFKKVTLAIDEKEYNKAIRILKKIQRLSKRETDVITALNIEANIYQMNKQWDKLTNVLENISKKYPTYINIMELGNVYFITQQYDKSRDAFLKAAKLSKKDSTKTNALLMAFFASLMLGDKKSSKKYIKLAFRIKPKITISFCQRMFNDLIIDNKNISADKKLMIQKLILDIDESYSTIKEGLGKLIFRKRDLKKLKRKI